MSDRLSLALTELVDALRQEVRADAAPVGDAPERLLDVNQAAAALGGIGRSLVYDLIGSGALRSLKVGRRRLLPAGAIADYIATKRTPAPLKAGVLEADRADRSTPTL